MQRHPCPQCGTNDWKRAGQGSGVTIFICARCGIAEQVAALTRLIGALYDRSMDPTARQRLVAAVTQEMAQLTLCPDGWICSPACTGCPAAPRDRATPAWHPVRGVVFSEGARAHSGTDRSVPDDPRARWR